MRVLSAIVLVSIVSAQAFAQGPDRATTETASRVGRYLETAGYNYSKLNATTWSVKFKGDHNDNFDVLMLSNAGNVIILTVIADRAQLDNNAPALRQLLKTNGKLPAHISVLLDNDDDYVIQASYAVKDFNNASFKKAVEEVALATDEAYGEIKGFLGKTPPGTSVNAPPAAEGRPPSSATRNVEFLGGRAQVSFDPAKWKETEGKEGRRQFEHVGGEAYAVIIAERPEIASDQLAKIALSNARQLAPDVRVVEEKRHRISGREVVSLRMDGTTDGVKLAFLGYYYGGPEGSIQVVTWTSQNLINELRPELEGFLNGLQLK